MAIYFRIEPLPKLTIQVNCCLKRRQSYAIAAGHQRFGRSRDGIAAVGRVSGSQGEAPDLSFDDKRNGLRVSREIANQQCSIARGIRSLHNEVFRSFVELDFSEVFAAVGQGGMLFAKRYQITVKAEDL